MAMANVLLVDDEVPFVETMTKRLTKRELQVASAFTGNEALDRLEGDSAVEVVILDVKMPGMDGIATLKEIKHRFPLVEVIMLTGHATVESAVDGLKSGATDYLMKPVGVDELVEKAEEAFAKRLRLEEKIRMAQARKFMKSPREILREAENPELD